MLLYGIKLETFTTPSYLTLSSFPQGHKQIIKEHLHSLFNGQYYYNMLHTQLAMYIVECVDDCASTVDPCISRSQVYIRRLRLSGLHILAITSFKIMSSPTILTSTWQKNGCSNAPINVMPHPGGRVGQCRGFAWGFMQMSLYWGTNLSGNPPGCPE